MGDYNLNRSLENYSGCKYVNNMLNYNGHTSPTDSYMRTSPYIRPRIDYGPSSSSGGYG